MVWDILSTKQQNVTFCRPKFSLLKHINQLKKTSKEQDVFEETQLCRQRPTKSCKTQIFLTKNDRKWITLKILNTNFFEEISL